MVGWILMKPTNDDAEPTVDPNTILTVAVSVLILDEKVIVPDPLNNGCTRSCLAETQSLQSIVQNPEEFDFKTAEQ